MIDRTFAARRALAGVLIAAFVLTGCGGRLIGVMQPAGVVARGSSPGTSNVDLLVATTRAPSSDPAVLFSGERGTGLTVNAVDVSIPPDANRKVGQVQWPSRLPADPQKSFVTVAVDPLQDERAGEE